MDQALTTMQVYRRDADKLEKRYGKPARNALRIALQNCTHPEDKRKYTTAAVNPKVGEPINSEEPVVRIAGYYCLDCCQYVFPTHT